MKGRVEVYAIAADGSETLLERGPNLVVNGAAESIVDMLTVPSSVLGIAPRVMDTSNWRWGAISFGPPAGSFQENGFFFPSGTIANPHIWHNPSGDCYAPSADVTSMINQVGAEGRLRLLQNHLGDVSSFIPPYRLPSYPDPTDTKLEDANTAYSIVSGDGTLSYGHLENRIAYASGDPSSYFQGGYPTGDTTPITVVNVAQAVVVSSFEGDFQSDPERNIVVNCPSSFYPEAHALYAFFSGVVGAWNVYSGMDYRGYQTLAYNYTGNANDYIVHAGKAVVSSTAGAATAEAFVVDPRVTMETLMGRWDLWALNNYGGLYQMGLWNMDCKAALGNGASAPLLEAGASSFENPRYVNEDSASPTFGHTKQEFRLFAKKTFSSNLGYISDQDVGVPFNDIPGFCGYQNLKIRWTLDFRSQHD